MSETMTRTRDLLGLIGWLLLVTVAAAIGAAASIDARDFYAQLQRPAWAPPGWLFGPAWTLLYTLMGIAAWLVWRQHGWRGSRGALLLFVVQLVVNAVWSWLFFAWRLGALAFVEIVLLWLLIAATLLLFWRLQRLAALLLVPYLVWVSFAGALCFTIWRSNPTLL